MRIARGAVANAITHSGVLQDRDIRIRIKVEQTDGEAIFQVSDDGRGQEHLVEGYGIGRMRQLVRQLKEEVRIETKFEIVSSPARGTTITVRVYLKDWNR